MPPLKKAPSSMLMRCAITSPVKEPSLRMSTRSLALMLPRTLPRTTTSRAEIFADTCPLRPTVTRLPGKLMAPSTLPSMYNDSEPVTSPFTTRLLPIVAGSAAAGDAGEVLEVRVVVDSWLAAAGTDGRVGSVLGDIEGLPGWFGFHISLVLPFVNCWIQAPEQPCGAVSAYQGKSGGTVSFLLIACPANAMQAAQSLLFSAS